jgi:hypothetical protein
MVLGALLSYLGSVVVNNLFGCQIALVTNKQFVDALASIAIDLLQPLLDVVERHLICDIVDNNDAVGTTVVAGSDGTESLLTGSIPDLEFDALAIHLNGSNFL